MRNHDEKTRDMARSVLPSTLDAKHWRRHIHHSERHRVRAALHRARTMDTADLGYLSDDGVDADRTKHHIFEMVQERREADKLGPLLRWAEHRVEHDPSLREASRADRLEYFRTRLPSGVTNRHALSHLRSVVDRTVVGRSVHRDESVTVLEAASWVMANGLHADLNDHLRSTFGPTRPVSPWKSDEDRPTRFLRGWHDVHDFSTSDSHTSNYKYRGGAVYRHVRASAEGIETVSFVEQHRRRFSPR